MRLLTHNMLVCTVKACTLTANRDPDAGPLNFPLQIRTDNMEVVETEYSKDFLLHMLKTIDWLALYHTVEALGDIRLPKLPKELPKELEDELLLKIHTVLLDTNVNEGELRCRNCDRSYPIQDGVPNLLLTADEM